MKILLTGATGYIAQRLLPVLLEQGHQIVCTARDPRRFRNQYNSSNIEVVEVDFLNKETLQNIPQDIDIAYYLIHSMSTNSGSFEDMEQICAENFIDRIQETKAQQIIYLSGIVNDEELSKHLSSRMNVESIISRSDIPLTTLRAGIIVGSGSASFEIIRDLVEKLPVMVAPIWLKTKCQPIAIRNVVEFLVGVIGHKKAFDDSFDIGGPDILSYKEMLLRFAEIRGLKRYIFVVPVMTPRISSYWLYFVTSTSYALAKNLVDSMKIEVIAEPNNLGSDLNIKLLTYSKAIKLAFDKIEQNQVLSSWKDAQTSNIFRRGMQQYMEVPTFGCFKDVRTLKTETPERTLNRIWAIGGETGYYYGNWLWKIRGFMDQLIGGVGLRRGRRSATDILVGETLDFWRVLISDKQDRRLLLFAEMKLPGEAWLEFKLGEDDVLTQTATFRPLGLWGRVYWYSVLPFHGVLFRKMIQNIVEGK